MAITTISDLQTRANQIKAATQEGVNTATKVGSLHLDTIDTLNNEIDSLENQINNVGGDQNAQQVLMGAQITTNQAVGGLASGSTVSATETVFNLFKRILSPIKLPSLSLTSSQAGNYEFGSNITAQFTSAFTQNDGGVISYFRLKLNGGAIVTQANNNNIPNQQINGIATNMSYTAEADYAANSGTGVGTGTATSPAVTFNAYRKGFCGRLTTTTIPNSSTLIRALSGGTSSRSGMLNMQNGDTMTVQVQAGDRGVCFAYPYNASNPRPVPTSIVQDGAIPMLQSFETIQVSVQGANSYAAVQYTVLYLIPEFAFSGTANFVLTI